MNYFKSALQRATFYHHKSKQMVQFSNSFTDFLKKSDSRIAQFIVKAMRYDRWDYPVYRLMVTDTEINYLTLRKDGTISYLPKGKPHVLNDDGEWARDGRQNGAAGKTIKKILPPNARKLFKDSEYEEFVNHYKGACDRENREFVMRPNEDIPTVYCMVRESGGGTLSDSCMNDDDDYLDLYKCCPKLRILTLVNGCEELCGRALVWDIGEGEVFMDRVYVSKDQYYTLFLDYARQHNWIRKVEYRSYRDKDYLTKDGEVYFRREIVIHTKTNFSMFPYIDTFTYGGDGWIKNRCSDALYEYCNTSGSRDYIGEEDDDDDVVCAHSGDIISQDDAYYIERGRYRGGWLSSDHTTYCETDGYYYWDQDEDIVEINNRWYRKDDDDVCYVSDDDEYYMADDCCWSDFHEEYIHSDNCSYSDHHETYIKDSEAYTVAGVIYHESVVDRV